MQCFNYQRYGHIAKNCAVEAKCGKCAGTQNRRDSTNDSEPRCTNCGRKHASWHQSCPARIAAKAKAMMIITRDPGVHERPEAQSRENESDWQIVGSRKMRAGPVGSQIIGEDGEIIRIGPGRHRKSTYHTTISSTASVKISTPTSENTARPVTRGDSIEISVVPICTKKS
ncbi:hypothetical protein K3495_g5704 [Podosphaera aphanis]|nr:hypothetical protein K3495_g5704 [Podosphaera aphanis]